MKKESAESEPAWQGSGKKPGVEVWRINKFKVSKRDIYVFCREKMGINGMQSQSQCEKVIFSSILIFAKEKFPQFIQVKRTICAVLKEYIYGSFATLFTLDRVL